MFFVLFICEKKIDIKDEKIVWKGSKKWNEKRNQLPFFVTVGGDPDDAKLVELSLNFAFEEDLRAPDHDPVSVDREEVLRFYFFRRGLAFYEFLKIQLVMISR